MKTTLNYLIISLFFIHGGLMFSVGGSVQEISFVKYIKYILLVIFILININKEGILKLFFPISLCLFFYFLYKISGVNHDLNLDEFMIRYLNLFSPFFLICLPINMVSAKTSIKIINLIALSSTIFCIMEYILLRNIISNFNFIDQGGFYRCISFYVNPNNAASIFSLLIIFYLYQISRYGNTYFKTIMVILLGISCILTGSKTPILILIIYFTATSNLYLYLKHSINKKILNISCYLLITLGIVITIFMYLSHNQIYTFRKMHSIKEDGRYDQLKEFIILISQDFISPNYNMTEEVMYDNTYLQLWSDFTFIGLLVFCSIILYFIMSNYYKISIHMISLFFTLFVLGFSLNVFYIWPLSYMVWYILFGLSSRKEPYKL